MLLIPANDFHLLCFSCSEIYFLSCLLEIEIDGFLLVIKKKCNRRQNAINVFSLSILAI